VLIAFSFQQNNVYPELTLEQRANFLYFYPPNQLIIFAVGFVLYHLVKHGKLRNIVLNSRATIGITTALLLIFCLVLSIYGQHKFFDFSSGSAPTHLIITLAFMLWALVLVIRRENSIIINRLIISLGKVSFSAYVLHFAVLKLVGAVLQKSWPFQTVGIASIPYAIVLIAISLILTWRASALTYKYIEQPFIALGKRLSMRMTVLGKVLTS
jgi:peptidoglycan/LPS O-acetylase OafA/YrhL